MICTGLGSVRHGGYKPLVSRKYTPIVLLRVGFTSGVIGTVVVRCGEAYSAFACARLVKSRGVGCKMRTEKLFP